MSAPRSLAKASRADQLGKRTWLEIDTAAIRRNIALFRRLIGPRVALWAVVKSNAYGHGLGHFARLAGRDVDGFCVDSIIEGQHLRAEGITKPMLVLGATLPTLLKDATTDDIAISVSNFDTLRALRQLTHPPRFHLKLDTGMHRQGFALREVLIVIRELARGRARLTSRCEGLFTHFASAKDLNYPTYTDRQFAEFKKATALFRRAGYHELVQHLAATGGTLIGKKYHADLVRVGIGLYGLWPSRELEVQLGDTIQLAPVLSWRTVITELKRLLPGDYVGYDLTERVTRPTTIAILPVGYWHGFPRSLSSVGEVLVRGRRARVLGRVSMDMIVVDVTDGPAWIGDEVTLIGRSGKAVVLAADIAARAGTTHYEYVTRLNPLMEKVIV